MADATLLSWINAEVERALLLVRDCIAKFTATPENQEALRPCPEHLHQVSGALRMVGLNGATLVCESIEGSFAGFGDARPTAAAMGIIDRAVLALKDFVGDLARGQADVPLRLFPVYRDLAQLKGAPGVSEKDLFFPDVTMRAPPHRRPKTIPADAVAPFVNKQRGLFQKGLLAWLRNPPAGLDDMRRAVNQLHKIAAQLPEPQSIWWVAHGFLDAVEITSDADWIAGAKALGNKIEKQMRGGTATVTESLLRELLFAIGKAKPTTQRLKDIRQLYQIDNLFPRHDTGPGVHLEFDIERLEVALYDLHSRLDALKRSWVQYVAGEHKTAAPFRERVTAFKAKARDLGNQHLIKLLDAIGLVASKLPDPYPRQTQILVIEMASAFLLVEHVLDNFTSPAADLDQQIGIMGGWLLDAAMGKSTGEPPPGVRPDLSERIGALHLRSQVAKEILANLQHVEQVLDAFARDTSKRATLPELQPYLRQMHGALVVLGMPRAAELLSICERLILACGKEGHKTLAGDMDWIAEGLSSLGFFLEPCRHGRDPAEEAIDLFFRRYEKRDAPPSLDTTMRMKSPVAATAGSVNDPTMKLEIDIPDAPPPAQSTSDARAGVDADLLAIYLEEAVEVLENIDKTVPECRARPDDREALTTIRRGFHTLKGSGRMVGLMDLGEAGWEVERAMNKWLEEKKPATPALLELITTASKSFAGWIAALKEGNLRQEVDAGHLVDLAAHLDAALAEVPAVQPAAEETIIGGMTMPRNFFDIYYKEASEHIAALEAQCREWRQMPGAEASHEFMRAAHTLASSSRTTGFVALADLAAALEHWTGFSARSTAPGDGELVQAAIAKLRWMVEGLAKRQAPAPDEETVKKLRALVARVESQPVPPIESKKPEPKKIEEKKPPEKEKTGREKRVMRDDIDPQLLPIFLEEAQALVPQLGADLRDWKANPADTKVSDSLRRVLHTFKGSARMAGAIRLGELCHIMESKVEEALEKNAYPKALWDELEEKMDRLSLDVERMETGAPEPEEAAPDPVAPAAATPAIAPQAVKAPAAPRIEPQRPAAPLPTPGATLRVNAETLDHLINESGEVAIARSRVEAELRTVRQALSDLNDSITRIRTQLREAEVQADSQMQSRLSVLDEKTSEEFDPLEFDRYTRLQELTRMMAEGLNDITSIQQALLKNVGDTDAALLQQARTSRVVQQELMRIRAVPFSNLNERLYRIVRQTARELGKKADLAIEGSEVELDRSVLERIGAPLEHMLRNALVHGLEMPEARVAAGKDETGKITITLRQESNEIALVLSDDGAGLDLDRLKKKGLDMGLIPAESEATEALLAQLIFVSGLSTAEQVSELAGRGVGMDVVKNEITAIGGRIEIATTRGGGTSFAVHLPLTLAVTQVVLVRAGATIVAISAAMVEQVMRMKEQGLNELVQKQSVAFQDRVYPLHDLRGLLGVAAAIEAQGYHSVLLLRSGIQRIALHVDELIGNEEIVVKNIGPQLARLPGVSGATVLADGAIVMILNPVQVAARARAAAAPASVEVQAQSIAPQVATPAVMVVDDSLTVRKITSRLLEREGYRVLLAKDGVDALEQMKDSLPAVLLVDIEMPRMDGFDLTRTVRGDARMQGIPIIMISSRTAEKHRSHAAELGVNAFLGKPYQESELLQHIAQHLRAA
jgi:chemosensory pili system protein ChpA (sensor histidine kinase/response regulator)